jgi:hypothetical protein
MKDAGVHGRQRAFENRLNVLLGRLLSGELGIRATSEYISRRDRPDIVIYVNGIKIVVEGSYSKTDAESDVKQKIEKGLGYLGVALYYREVFPQNLTDSELEERLKVSTFEVKFIIPEDISDTLLRFFTGRKIEPRWVTSWIEAGVRDLVSILNEAIQFIISEEDINQATSRMESEINDFVTIVRNVDENKMLAKKLYELFYKLYGLSVGDYREIDELIYAKAALTILLSAIFYQSVRAQISLEGLNTLCQKHGNRIGLRKAFEAIYNIDYKPVYDLAIKVLEALPDTLSQALGKLIELAEECSSKRTLLRRDFAGKVYHKIVGDWAIRKNFATYFTSVPAAYLLAYLSVFTRTGVFANFREVKVGDLACGSGTLLTAAYNALKDLYIDSRLKEGEVDLKSFHKLMLEESVWGIDALRYAVQIASTNLALQDPSTQVRRMYTFTVPLGVENKTVTLGSLEFLEGRGIPSIAMYHAGEFKFLERAEATSIVGGEVPSELPEFDLIIMNPPFTRATGRGGKKGGGLFGFILDESTRESILKEYEKKRKKVQEKLKALQIARNLHNIFSNIGVDDELYAIGQAGEGLLFLYLASERVKEGGKIAFVLPKSLLTGVSWFLARCLLLEKFHLEHVVISYDAENGYNFSESTNLSETLIVAKKREKLEKPVNDEETTVTILLRKPTTSLEARALAFKILRTENNEYVEVNGARAYVRKFPRSDLVANLDNWGKLFSFPSYQLNMITNEIFSGKIYGKKLPITFLGAMVEVVGLAVRRGTFHNIFRKVEEGTPGAIQAIIGGDEGLRIRIATKPNAKVICTNQKYLSTASKFIVPDRFWVDTTHALALYCSEPVVANLFFGLRLGKGVELDENRFKTLILWLNTTWGILSILANRTETRGRWIELTTTKWKLQPVLNVAQLDEETIGKLTQVFDQYCDKELRRLPDQFNPSDIDAVRKDIDQGFLEAMGIKVDEMELKDLYRLIYENLKVWIKGEFNP